MCCEQLLMALQNTWMIASSMISGTGTQGLAWWQAWLCVWIGYTIAGFFICLTGRIGATYHIPFPVVARSSFGIWGSLWPVFNRAAMACIWYGVQSWIGGECVTLMIRAIWPQYTQLPNSMPSNSGTNTRDYLSFFLFWLVSLPAIWFPVHKIRHLFTVKAFFVPTAGIAYFIWTIVKAKGIGPVSVSSPSASYALTHPVDSSSTWQCHRLGPRLGHGARNHEQHCQLRNSNRQRP